MSSSSRFPPQHFHIFNLCERVRSFVRVLALLNYSSVLSTKRKNLPRCLLDSLILLPDSSELLSLLSHFRLAYLHNLHSSCGTLDKEDLLSTMFIHTRDYIMQFVPSMILPIVRGNAATNDGSETYRASQASCEPHFQRLGRESDAIYIGSIGLATESLERFFSGNLQYSGGSISVEHPDFRLIFLIHHLIFFIRTSPFLPTPLYQT